MIIFLVYFGEYWGIAEGVEDSFKIADYIISRKITKKEKLE